MVDRLTNQLIELPNSDMMSRKMAELSIVEHLEVSLRPLHPKGVAGTEPLRTLCMLPIVDSMVEFPVKF